MTTMPRTTSELWQEIGNRFDPFHSDVPPEWWVERQNKPALKISRRLEDRSRTAPYHILLMGPIGSGKTTELYRIIHARTQARDCVVFLDVFAHIDRIVKDINAIEKIEAWEVIFLIGLALINKARKMGYSDEDLNAPAKALAESWQRLAQNSNTPGAPVLEVGGIFEAAQLLVPALLTAAGADPETAHAVTAGTGMFSKALSSVKNWFIPIGRSQQHISDQDSEAQRLLNTVNSLIDHIQQRHEDRQLLLFIDGLDYIRDMNRARMVMIDSTLITQLKCSLLITAPYALYQRRPEVLQTRYSYCCALYDEAVLDKEEPWKDGPGIETLLSLYERRTADLACTHLIHPEWLRYIAYYSAGHVRTFVSMIRELADNARLENAERATEELVDETLTYRRKLLGALIDKADIQILQGVIDDEFRSLPDDEKTQDLLQKNRLLCYQNHIEWYFPHTLLTMFHLRMRKQRPKPELP